MLSLREIIRVTRLYERGNKHKLPRISVIKTAVRDLEAEQARENGDQPYRDPNREHSTYSRGVGI